MEAVPEIDKARDAAQGKEQSQRATRRKVLVIDDSLMLLSFVKEILTEAHYEVETAASAQEGIAAAAREMPQLVLLDYVLPDMRGNEVAEQLRAKEATGAARIVYMSGFGSEVRPEQIGANNVIGSLNKPFTSDLLKETVAKYMPPESPSPEAETATAPPADATPAESPAVEPAVESDAAVPTDVAAAAGETAEPWWSAPASSPPTEWKDPVATEATESVGEPQEISAPAPEASFTSPEFPPPPVFTEAAPPTEEPPAEPAPAPAEPMPVTSNTFFCGDSAFFSVHWALQTIGRQRLTGVLRCFWDKATIELLARNGEIVLVTTRDPELYCPEAPITLVNVDATQTAAARDQQRETGCPMFLTLSGQNLVLREPAMQLVQHYGQKLFAQLWSADRVRFVFELMQLPDYANDVPGDGDIDQWALSTLRLLQFQELRDTPDTDASRIPAYTRDGYERVQKLRLTVAEAQFASQFNGVRSIGQIAKNLRLDIKFARLTLFRFLALEIVECWPATVQVKQERRGFFQRIGSSIGLGD